jgi:hypothetical protein
MFTHRARREPEEAHRLAAMRAKTAFTPAGEEHNKR